MDDDVGAELAARLHLHYGGDERHDDRHGDACLLLERYSNGFEIFHKKGFITQLLAVIGQCERVIAGRCGDDSLLLLRFWEHEQRVPSSSFLYFRTLALRSSSHSSYSRGPNHTLKLPVYWRKSFLKNNWTPVMLDKCDRVHGVIMMPLLILNAAALMS